MWGLEPLTPRYGRDYKSIQKFKEDLYAGKDFTSADGRACSLTDLLDLGQRNVRVRYDRLTKTGIIDLMECHNKRWR